jgi:prophage DNA circulation protein
MTTPEEEASQVTESGAADWRARLAPTIELISPTGRSFSAYWRGGPRNKDKRLGIFDYPGVNGNVVQDLGISSDRYSITIYFEGKDHDLQARDFYNAANETGLWEVNHPVHGFLGLQMISIREANEPVSSGNITEVTTEWIEPIDEISLQTARELAGIIDNQSETVNDVSSEQFQDEMVF